jgi:general secretion pathway protein J
MSAYQARGFTLIEVLIAMTLLSIMVVLLFGSLKICADSWEKGESKIAEVNEVAVVYNFFQRHLSVAQPLWNDLSEEGERTFAFQGKAQSLQFVSAFPASAGRSGLQLFSLELQNEDNQQVINVTIIPFFPVVEGEEWHKEEVTLIKGVTEFTMAYYGSEGGDTETWQDQWLDREVLPRLLKINIELENGTFWPEMIIELKVTGVANDISGQINNTENPDNALNPDGPEAVE